jgi:polar amino acid transport system permease protein
MEAAEALGFTRFKAIWNVILPQALRFALPAWSNEAITVVKDTSLAYAIGVTELMRHADYLAVTTMEPLLVYGGAAALYYVVCTILAKALRVIEYRKKIPGFGQK